MNVLVLVSRSAIAPAKLCGFPYRGMLSRVRRRQARSPHPRCKSVTDTRVWVAIAAMVQRQAM
jgi:hypothetical protein